MNNLKLRKFLIKIGISANLQGHFYILDAVELISSQQIHTSLTTVYEVLSEKYDKRPCRIERGIRHAITQSYKKYNTLKAIYDTIPDNSMFLYDLVFNFDVLSEE